MLDGIPVQVDASIGIALFPEHAATAVELLKHADVAMYQAKRDRARRRALPRGARRPQPRPARPARRAARRHPARRARAALPAPGRHRAPAGSAASRRSCAGSTRRTACLMPGGVPAERRADEPHAAVHRARHRRRARAGRGAGRAARSTSRSRSTSPRANLARRRASRRPSRGCCATAGVAPDRLCIEVTENAVMADAERALARARASCASSACASRSTTSAPATRRSRASSTCPSTS